MGFKSTVYGLLDIEEAEASRVFLLLVMGFFMGIFLATLDVGASSLFLNNISEADLETQLPLAIITSGILGIVFTAAYTFFQGRIYFRFLSVGALLIIAAILVGIESSLRTFEDLSPVYFFAFTFIVPSNFIVLLVFWGVFGRMFNLRQSKRIIGSIDTGQLVASIVALFSIPIILNYVTTADLLLISVLSMVGLILTLLVILQRRLFLKATKSQDSRIRYTDIFKNKYITLMALFVSVSMIAVNFVDYSFLNVTKMQFDEDSLPNFLSYFEATVVIFSFLFQTFVTDRIIAMYGLKVSLLINPILIGLFTGAAVLIGFLFGYSPESESLIFFFIIISMSKLFNASLKDALDGPAFKLYFLPINTSIKFDVQTKIEGVVTAFAGLIAGAFLIVIENIRGLDLIYISIFTLPVIAVWYIITQKMHNNYRHTLQDSLLQNRSQSGQGSAEHEYGVDRILENQLSSEAHEKVLYGLRLMEKLEPSLFEASILKLMDSDSPEIKGYAREQARKLDLEFDRTSEIGQLARQAAAQAEDSDLISIDADRLEKLSKSIKSQDRLLAAKLLRGVSGEKNIFILLELLRDIDPNVKAEALVTARKLKLKETWGVLIDLLDSPTYYSAAAAALTEAGKSALTHLETAFHKSGQSDMVMLKIVQIIGRIGGAEALQLLWKKIEFPDRRIVAQILLSLRYYNYQATGREATSIINLLENEIGKAIWNIAAISELPEEPHFHSLSDALKEEVKDNFDMIYMLLSILYDPQSVKLVRQNAESETSDGAAYAIELMDLFLAPDLKPKLFPLIDDINVESKIRQLQIHFPRENYTPIQTLNYILNRNYNQVNRWTKACAMHATAFMDNFRISRGLVAQLFNSDQMLQEVAAWVIYHKDQAAYSSISDRLKPDIRKNLQTSIERNKLHGGLTDGFYLNVEMVMFLKSVPEFKNIKGSILSGMADKMLNRNLSDGSIIKIDPLVQEEHIFIISEGEVSVKHQGEVLMQLSRGDVFGNLVKTGEEIIVDEIQCIGDAVVFELSVHDFCNAMSNHYELAQVFLKNMEKKLVKVAK